MGLFDRERSPPVKPVKTRGRHYPLIAATALVAAIALVLAWPRLRASYRYLPVDIAIQNYYSKREIPTDRLPVLIRFAGEAIAHNDHYRYHDGLSLLHLLRALDIHTPALERRDEYRAAESEAMESLQRAPTQPASWLRLANIRWILHDEPENILAPWKMSIFTGRTDSSLVAQRVEIGMAFHDFMDEEGVAMLRDQLLLTWRMQPGSLMQVLHLRDRQLTITHRLIGETAPQVLADMETWFAKVR
jgi:hypothetical protein